MPPSSERVTQLLVDWSGGQKEALAELMPLVYDELHRLAERYLRRERPDHTLSATALVHEAYLRLVGQTQMRWQDRAHFFGIAANLMRQILLNYARDRHRAKRGGTGYKLTLDEANGLVSEQAVDLVALDDALTSLAQLDPQKSRIIELRFFGGLSVEETAEVLDLSPSTVKREWRLARAWLHCQLAKGGLDDG